MPVLYFWIFPNFSGVKVPRVLYRTLR